MIEYALAFAFVIVSYWLMLGVIAVVFDRTLGADDPDNPGED